MSSYDFDLVVLGSGPAGQRAAVQAAKVGRSVAIIERLPSLGGVCIITGTIPSKTYREAVLAAVQTNVFDDSEDLRNAPSMASVLSRVQSVMLSETKVIRNQLTRNGVELIQGTGRFSGDHELQVTGYRGERRVTGKNILIAVGTRPATPPNVSVDGQVILTSDEVLAMDEIPSSMTVVGGGVIGVEYASMFAHLGVKTTLIDRNERPISFMDHEIVDDFVDQAKAKGMDFHLNSNIAETTVHGGISPHAVIELTTGQKITSDVVLFSVGRNATTDMLNLEAIGLQTGNRGYLEVDSAYRTNVDYVWAAGDVIGFPALAATSSEQGRIAACRMFGIDTPDMGHSYPYGIYSIPEISMVGATEEQLVESKTPYEVGMARYSEIARGQILGDDSGLFKMLFHSETGRLLGVHCIGTGATELVHVGQAVLKLGGGLDYFLETVFNYPTLAECYKVAAYSAANKMGYHHVSLETPASITT